MGRRRAFVLIAVHVVFLLHILHWQLAPTTLSPVEPSEAMQTLERGRINAGFIFFCLAIIATIAFGRVFCGWGCHVVALQDWCGAMMKRAGIRPKPFRSRLLLWFPTGIAFYMFAWPTVRRAIVGLWPASSAVLGEVAPFPGFSLHLMEENFWQTFPTIAVAIPFLFICGFAAVYFLGSKGFCTYGCPYGALFVPADRLAFGRINADLDACSKCGHCTATCTSNVRVHEEIQNYRRVVSPGCMKCMDCVSVCPTNALSFGFGRPSIATPAIREVTARPKYDLTWPQEIFLSLVALGTFIGVRGAYGHIPMLMAVGVSLVTVFAAWKAVTLPTASDAAFHRFTLKRGGRWQRAGVLFTALAGLWLLLIAHTSWVNANRLLGERHDGKVRVQREQVLRAPGTIPEETRARAEAALTHYRRARSLSAGGHGLLSTAELPARVGWLQMVAGRPGEAAATLAPMANDPQAAEGFVIDYGRILLQAEGADAAIDYYDDRVGAHPEFARLRATLASIHMQSGRHTDAVRLLREATALQPNDARLVHDLAVALFLSGARDEGIREMRRATTLDPTDDELSRRLREMELRTGH